MRKVLAGLVCLVFISVNVFAQSRPNNKKQPARAATGSKRAATGSKRASTTNKTSARAAAKSNRAATRARASSRSRNASGSTGSTRAAPVAAVPDTSNQCPVGKTLKRTFGDSTDFDYYSAKNTKCDLPDNADERVWTKSVSEKYNKPSWIQEEEAVYFLCTSGYVQMQDANKKNYCLDADTICPIGPMLEKIKQVAAAQPVANSRRTRGAAAVVETAKPAANMFDNPDTGSTCTPPKLAKVKPVAGNPDAVTLECPVNTFAATVEGAGNAKLRCQACPYGYISPAGSTSETACYKSCEEGLGADPSNRENCVACHRFAEPDSTTKKCVCHPDFTGDGVTNCAPKCPDGQIPDGNNGCKAACTNGQYMQLLERLQN